MKFQIALFPILLLTQNAFAQNVGIGTTTPHAPLQFGNLLNDRKLVLYEDANNNHQVYGFGINVGILRYQIPNSAASHVFYTGVNSTSSQELMRITGTGRVGIGVADPNEPLEIGGTGRAFFGNGAGASRKGLLIDAGATASRIETYNYGTNSPMSLVLNPLGGNVAVNLFAADNKLDIHNGPARTNTHPQGLPLYVTGNISADTNGIEFRHYNATQGIGFGYNTIYAAGSATSQELGLRAKGSSGHLRFHTNENERMRITASGNVGIGTTAPTEKLEVAGNVKITGNINLTGTIQAESTIHPDLHPFYTNVGGVVATVGYYKDRENRVFLSGSATSPNNPDFTTIFTLPAGYRPLGTQHYSVYNGEGNELAHVIVVWNGEIVILSGSPGILSLDQISFRAEQ